ncbi:MAG: 1-deoxy-D-xylulose-5-phosphate reductoisomerase, partial [Sphingobacteriaceae bacterium]
VLTALVGFAGLQPTIAAIKAGKDIALANKETLVVAGELVMNLAKKHGVNILPVDSEHSAIFQCLVGEEPESVEKIILTASGGPFRGKDRIFLSEVTKHQALKHPNWVMGAKITIDSASLMNKGLEVIEAKWLFDLAADQIDVIVHPQSIIHSLVQFKDSSMKAQMGLPDMKLPIQYALTYPQRIKNNFERFSFANFANLTFEQPDLKTFRNLALAFAALDTGGNMPCIVNAANEIAVEGFLKEQISFLGMSDLIEECTQRIALHKTPELRDYLDTDLETRILAKNLLNKGA